MFGATLATLIITFRTIGGIAKMALATRPTTGP
jgi:hypothetical protein